MAAGSESKPQQQASQAGPTSSSSSVRVSARRATRSTPRPPSSLLGGTAKKKVGRPPIILEWGTLVLRVGYAEQSLPQHIIPLPSEPFERLEESKRKDNNKGLLLVEEESRWYNGIVSPIVRQMFDRLMVDPTARRVVVVASPYPLRAWEVALKKALWNLGVPAVSFLNYLEVVPTSLGWHRGLVLHVGQNESHCLAHVDGHTLPFTYQVVPCGYKVAVEDESKLQCQWSEKMDKIWLDENNPHSLIVALIKCLEACPVDARKDVIANLVFCGDALMAVPDLGRRAALKLKKILLESNNSADPAASPIDLLEEEPVMTFVPVATEKLKALAQHVGVLSCAPYRADLVSWVGASVYSTICHRYDDSDSRLQWNYAPTKASE